MPFYWYIIYILLAIIPGIFWLWFYYKKDSRPEPKKLVFQIFCIGMLITIPAIILEIGIDIAFPYSESQNIFIILIGTFIIIAPIEEFAKYIVVKRTVYNNKEFDEKIDGVIYCIASALGFATIENIFRIFSEGKNNLISTFILMLITTTLMHAITSGILGFHLGLAKFNKANYKSLIIQGFIIAVILHGMYNFIAATNTPITIILLVILMIVMFFMLKGEIKKLKKNTDLY